MAKRKFTPFHINATTTDLKGNGNIGRYIFLPGSDGRAQQIAARFKNLTVKKHPRGHHLYLGNLEVKGKKIAVAAISSGMGCPSMEIILHELHQLGATRFLRVGTAGSLQPQLIKSGAIVNARASVRDESTTLTYAPIEVPALASLEYIFAITAAAKKLNKHIFTGTVHCKSALYAREFGAGPRGQENNAYINLLKRCGVLASEMETAALFVLTQIYKQESKRSHGVLCGAILGVIAGNPENFSVLKTKKMTKDLIDLAIETTKIIAANDGITF